MDRWQVLGFITVASAVVIAFSTVVSQVWSLIQALPIA